MAKKVIQRMLIIGGIFLGVLLLGVLAITAVSYLQPRESAPQVTIHSPSSGSQIQAGATTGVDLTVSDPVYPITRVELWELVGGKFRLISADEPPEPLPSYSLQFAWQPEAAGTSRLIARGFNRQEDSGQASVDLVIVEQAAVEEPEEEEAPAGMDPSPPIGEAAPGSEGEEVPEGGNTPPPDPDPDPSPPNDPGEIFFDLVAPFFVVEAYFPPTPVKFEILSFEVVNNYAQVYCYYSLMGQVPNRVPQVGSFGTDGQNSWNLQAYLGGQNRLEIAVPSGEELPLYLSCRGREQIGSVPEYLGKVQISHPSSDWNGQVIQKDSQGGTSFSVSYRIALKSESIPAPDPFLAAPFLQHTNLMWAWEGDEAEIDGFHLYRNQNLVMTLPADERSQMITGWWTKPPCSEEFIYHLTAYKDGIESAPSSPVNFQGEACGFTDLIQAPQLIGHPCGSSGNTLLIKYRYGTPEIPFSPTRLGVRFFVDQQLITEVHGGRPRIQHGTGVAKIDAISTNPDPIVTNRVEVYLENNHYGQFYSQAFDMLLEWNPGQPDLAIAQAKMDLDDNQLKFRYDNRGCWEAGNTSIAISREADGQLFTLNTSALSALSRKTLDFDINPAERELWTEPIVLTVDPLNGVEESNEQNNQYLIDSARFKNVQFTQFEVFNDHDTFNAGEWELYFQVSRAQEGTYQYLYEQNRNFNWGPGVHNTDLRLSPTLSGNDGVAIRIWGNETDTFPPHITSLGIVQFYLTADGSPNPSLENSGYTLLGSWKEGGTYTIESSKGDYEATFKINLE